MSYGILLSDEARHDLAQLPIPVRRFVFQQLHLLGENPTALSKRSHFPYREKCQIFPFDYDYGLQRWEINVLFQYSADEQHVYVLCIGRSARDPWDGVDADSEPEPD